MRFLFRTIGLLFLAVGVVFAVGDIARNLADDVVRLATVGEAFASIGVVLDPRTAADPRIGEVMAAILSVPAAMGFGVLALICLVLGRSPRRDGLRRSPR